MKFYIPRYKNELVKEIMDFCPGGKRSELMKTPKNRLREILYHIRAKGGVKKF